MKAKQTNLCLKVHNQLPLSDKLEPMDRPFFPGGPEMHSKRREHRMGLNR